MRSFLKRTSGIFIIPLAWAFVSVLFQRYVYNPIGNPEFKHQFQQLQDNGVIFVGPSVFYQRINEEYLEDTLGINIQLVSSIGQSTLESFVISQMVHDKAKHAKVFVAAHDREINGKGLHQCWSCSNLPIDVIISEWDEVRECFCYDVFLGIFAEFVPTKFPLSFAKTLAAMTIDEGWLESHRKYNSNSQSSLEAMNARANTPRDIPRFYLYEKLSTSPKFKILVPPNGRFQKCPDSCSIPCFDVMDTSWIRKEYWFDPGHLSPVGATKFTSSLLPLLQEVSK